MVKWLGRTLASCRSSRCESMPHAYAAAQKLPILHVAQKQHFDFMIAKSFAESVDVTNF